MMLLPLYIVVRAYEVVDRLLKGPEKVEPACYRRAASFTVHTCDGRTRHRMAS